MNKIINKYRLYKLDKLDSEIKRTENYKICAINEKREIISFVNIGRGDKERYENLTKSIDNIDKLY